jgi:hypothetical protein
MSSTVNIVLILAMRAQEAWMLKTVVSKKQL